MKIKTKDLHDWIMNSTPIRYRDDIYKLHYNGSKYFLFDHIAQKSIDLYKISRGVWGLETNRK
jgi:hypothetical protein